MDSTPVMGNPNPDLCCGFYKMTQICSCRNAQIWHTFRSTKTTHHVTYTNMDCFPWSTRKSLKIKVLKIKERFANRDPSHKNEAQIERNCHVCVAFRWDFTDVQFHNAKDFRNPLCWRSKTERSTCLVLFIEISSQKAAPVLGGTLVSSLFVSPKCGWCLPDSLDLHAFSLFLSLCKTGSGQEWMYIRFLTMHGNGKDSYTFAQMLDLLLSRHEKHFLSQTPNNLHSSLGCLLLETV